MSISGEYGRQQLSEDEVREKLAEWLGREPNAIEMEEAHIFLIGGKEAVERAREYARRVAEYRRLHPTGPSLHEIYPSPR